MPGAGVDLARNEFDGLMNSEAYAYSRSAAASLCFQVLIAKTSKGRTAVYNDPKLIQSQGTLGTIIVLSIQQNPQCQLREC